jgi:hypothetical protein
LHAHYGPVGNSYRFARELLGAPFLVSFYGYDCWAVPRKEGPEVYRKLFETADCVLVLADEMGKQLQTLGCPANRQRKLAVGVRVEEFAFQERKLKPGEPVRVLTIARFVEKKGLEYSLRAVAEVQKKRGGIKYDIIGDGPLLGQVQKLIAELQLEKTVTLHGYCEGKRVHELMSAAHILMLSSVTAADGDHYDAARTTFNATVQRRPAVIVRVRTDEDVIAAVVAAADLGLPIAVRGGGHSVAGHAMADAALVVDLRDLRSVEPSASGPVFGNGIEGTDTGLEASGTWRVLRGWRLSAGTLQQHQVRRISSGASALGGVQSLGNDPAQIWTFRSSLDLGARVEFDVMLRELGALPSPAVPGYTAVDARLAWTLLRDLQLAVSGQNLLDASHPEWGVAPGRPVFERAVFVKLAWAE